MREQADRVEEALSRRIAETEESTRALEDELKAVSIVDVLWGQPIKLIHVASNAELSDNQWNDLLFFELFPLIAYTANVYRQTTDKLMFKSVISTVR